MEQILFDRKGNCTLCGGTNVCLTCDGSGEHPFLKGFSCPTCKGKGDCACHGQKKNTLPPDPKRELQSLRALCYCPKTKHSP